MKKTLVILDREFDYNSLLADYFRLQTSMPLEIHSYSDPVLMKQSEEKIDILLLAESVLEELGTPGEDCSVILLDETGNAEKYGFTCVSKYKSAADIYKAVLQIYSGFREAGIGPISEKTGTRFIGFFTPLQRGGQSAAALTLGRLLAETKSVLYVNMQAFSEEQDILADRETKDLADLLYFSECESRKFRLHLQIIRRQLGELHFIPPVKYQPNLTSVTAPEWMNFLRALRELGEYDYILLDFSEGLQGLFELLRSCEKVFSLEEESAKAKVAIRNYREMLRTGEYTDISEKSISFCIPPGMRLPETGASLGRNEWTEFVRGLWEGAQ